MAQIVFYEKPAAPATRGRRLLNAAGHRLIVRDLRDVAWTTQSCSGFLAPLLVADWFNRSRRR